MSPQYGELRPSGWDLLASLRHRCKFQRVSNFNFLASLLHGTLLLGVSQTLRCWTEGATCIWQGGHHVGHWPTFLVLTWNHALGQHCHSTRLSRARQFVHCHQLLNATAIIGSCKGAFPLSRQYFPVQPYHYARTTFCKLQICEITRCVHISDIFTGFLARQGID